MAYGVKYRMEWSDQFKGDDFKIDIEKDGYASSVIGLGHTDESFVLSNPDGGGEDGDESSGWVSGLEGVISFYVPQSDKAAYDADFYNSVYKNLKVKFFINGTLKNVGWVKPENTTRQVIQPEVQYRISFTDGLNDLKDVDYVGFQSAGRQSPLQVIKNALDFIGLTELPFFIQCNLYESAIMVAGDNVFTDLAINNNNFYKVEEGELRSDKCFEVLEKCVKPFYCRLAQVNGFWQITNGQEYNSTRDTFAYSNLASISANGAYNREVDISDFYAPAENQLELTKTNPLKNLRVILRNRTIFGNELINGDFETGTTTGWNNGAGAAAWQVFQNVGNKLRLVETQALGDPDVTHSFSATTFNVPSIGAGDGFFSFQAQLELVSQVYITGDYPTTPPYVKFRLTYPDTSFIETSNNIIQVGTAIYNTTWPVDQLGNYTLTIYYIPNSGATLTSIELLFDDISLTRSDQSASAFDLVFVNTSSVEGYGEEEVELAFGDGIQLFDVAPISANNSAATLTTRWVRYGITLETRALTEIFAQQLLNDHRAYHDVITVELYDINDEIHYNSILVYDSKRYRFTDYNKNYFTKLITATIQQVSNADIAFDRVTKTLSTSDGENTSTSSNTDLEGVATEAWVLLQIGNYLPLSGGVISGAIILTSTINDVLNFTGTSVGPQRGIAFNSRSALTADDGDNFLRLNQGSEFSDGVFTPGNFRVDGLFHVDSSSRGLKNVTGSFGNVETTGTGVGGWEGFSIAGRVVFMNEASGGNWGIYNDIDNEFFIDGTRNGAVELFYNGSVKLATTTVGVSITGVLAASTEVNAPGAEFGILELTGSLQALEFSATSVGGNRGITFNNRVALTADDGDNVLRLNNNSDFDEVSTPEAFRVEGNILADGGFIFLGTSGAVVRTVTGTYGSIQTAGTGVGGYQGYSINGRLVLMEEGTGAWYLYNDVDNEALIFGQFGAQVELYYNNSKKIETTNTGVKVTGGLVATGEIEAYDTSDLRLKKDIEDLTEVLPSLRKLRTIRYTHTEKKKREIGVIAQDIKQYFPELVKEDDNGFEMVHYGKLVSLCIAAIKELSNKVDGGITC